MLQINFKNISKKYEGGFTALNNISFGINAGEFVFLVGHSGAGKSTITKILTREEYPTEGDVLFNERSIFDYSLKELPLLRRKIAVIYQDFKVLPSKTVFENVAVSLEVVDAPYNEIKQVVPNVLGMVGLQNKINKFPTQLSGGEKQRLAIARALAHEPAILLADEPTGMIDPQASKEIMSILDKINKLGTTIIMATHDKAIVDSFKKRVIKLQDGQVAFDKESSKYDG